MNKKRSLKLNELKVFFTGIQLVDNVDEINFDSARRLFDENLEKFYMNNYNRLKNNLTFVHQVDYSNLMNVINEIPTDYFKKFNHLNYVRSIVDIINQEHFLWFLKSVKNLSDLHLKYPNLNQSIYDRLPESCSLTSLKLKKREYYQLNFNFIAKFDKLKRLELNTNVSLEVVKSLIIHSMSKTLNFDFSFYKFKYETFSFKIQKKEGNKYNLRKLNNLVKEDVSSNEIVNYFVRCDWIVIERFPLLPI